MSMSIEEISSEIDKLEGIQSLVMRGLNRLRSRASEPGMDERLAIVSARLECLQYETRNLKTLAADYWAEQPLGERKALWASMQ